MIAGPLYHQAGGEKNDCNGVIRTHHPGRVLTPVCPIKATTIPDTGATPPPDPPSLASIPASEEARPSDFPGISHRFFNVLKYPEARGISTAKPNGVI